MLNISAAPNELKIPHSTARSLANNLNSTLKQNKLKTMKICYFNYYYYCCMENVIMIFPSLLFSLIKLVIFS